MKKVVFGRITFVIDNSVKAKDVEGEWVMLRKEEGDNIIFTTHEDALIASCLLYSDLAMVVAEQTDLFEE